MLEKWDDNDKYDIVKELIWTLLLVVASFVYWMALLLILSFVFNSIINLSFQAILLISIFLSISMLIYRVVRTIAKLVRK